MPTEVTICLGFRQTMIEAWSLLQAGSSIQTTGNHVLLTVETHRTMTSFMRSRLVLLKWFLKVSQKMLQKESVARL